MTTLATHRLIVPAENIASDVAVRVDEWLRGVSARNPTAGSESSRSNGGSGLPDLSSIHDQPIQSLSQASPSDKVRSWLDYGSPATSPPERLVFAPRHGSAFTTTRPQTSVAILLANNRSQNGDYRPPANTEIVFHGPVPIARGLRHSSARSHVGVRGPTPSTLGKGKAPEFVSSKKSALATIEQGQNASICGICQEEFSPTSTPLRTAQAPTSSLQSARYGMSLSCPSNHGYCLDCLTSYIRVKLEDKEGHARFPVRCPECPARSNWEIDDETAGRVLVKDLLDAWHLQRLLASLDMFYCPNPKCSEAIEKPHDIFEIDRTECPACRSEICGQCHSMWHVGLTCEDAKNPLPDEEALQRLAERNHWRRCPRCGVMVERTEGCNHMTCRCGEEFCFACGAHYAGWCTRVGGCNGQWQVAGGARVIPPFVEAEYTRPMIRPRRHWDLPRHPQLLVPRPRTPPPFIPVRFPETPIAPVFHEARQQEPSVVSRPRRLQRRRQDDDEPAPTQVARPRKLSRPRRPAPIPMPSNLSIPRRRDYSIPRLWRSGAGGSRDQTPNQEATLSDRRLSGTPTEDEWVVVNSSVENAGQTTDPQTSIPDEGARAPNTRGRRNLGADARMKPLPPVPTVTPPIQATDTSDVGNSSRLAFPPRPRRDSEQSGHTRRGNLPLRIPRLSLPGRSRP